MWIRKDFKVWKAVQQLRMSRMDSWTMWGLGCWSITWSKSTYNFIISPSYPHGSTFAVSINSGPTVLSLFTPEKAPRVSGPTQFKFALPKGLLVCYLFQQITNLFEHKSLCCAQSCLTLQPHELHVACQAPASMGISKQEYWSGLLLPPPGDLPDPGIEPTSPALAPPAKPILFSIEVGPLSTSSRTISECLLPHSPINIVLSKQWIFK